jgi:hypothetical protein
MKGYSLFGPTSHLSGASAGPLPFRNEKRNPVFKGQCGLAPRDQRERRKVRRYTM